MLCGRRGGGIGLIGPYGFGESTDFCRSSTRESENETIGRCGLSRDSGGSDNWRTGRDCLTSRFTDCTTIEERHAPLSTLKPAFRMAPHLQDHR
jgi:hypothetical protein